MPKTKKQKEEILEKLVKKIKDSKSIFFARYEKLTVNESETLRKNLRADNGEFLVAKKTLTDLALKESGLAGAEAKKLEGQTGLIFSHGDEVSALKIADKFRNDHEEKFGFLGGFLEGRFICAEEVIRLAKLPSRQELYAKLVGSINAPVSGFVNVLAGNLRGLLYALKAIQEKKQ